MDPTRPLHTPVAEVRHQSARYVDSYGETWVVIDGIETKVPSIAQAKALLVKQDAIRAQIRADLDALGIRDRTEKVTMKIDGEDVEVDMLPAGDSGANILQIGDFPRDPKGTVIENPIGSKAAEIRDRLLAMIAEADKKNHPTFWQRVKRRVKRALRGKR